MYLLNAITTIEWEIFPTLTPPALGDLDLLVIDPNGTVTYLDAPIDAGNYTPPTDTETGIVTYDITPNLEGLWRIRLVIGTASSYNILSKVEMYVFDNTTVTSPYSDEIGRPVPYDINFYLQGYIVSSELYGTFVASRTIAIDTNAPGSRAVCEDAAKFFTLTLNIIHNEVQIGTIFFPLDSFEGVITIEPKLISPGDKLQIKVASGVADEYIRDIAINLVGCCTIVPCTVL